MNNKIVTLYHNPKCSKSRQTLELLRSRGVEPVIVNYLQDPPNNETLQQILEMLSLDPLQLIRQGESLFKELQLEEADLSQNEWLDIMRNNPRLIQRPIVVIDNQAAIGRPLENITELLDKTGL